MKFGVPLVDAGSRDDVFGYQATMAEGTAVVCQLGERDVSIGMTVVTPGKDLSVPGSVVPAAPATGGIYASSRGLVEPVVIVAESAGSYVLRVELAAAGKYSITCADPRPATPADRKYSAAQKLIFDIRREREGKATPPPFVAKAEERLAIYTELGDRAGIALSAMDVARAYYDLGDYDKALLHNKRVLEIYRELNSWADMSSALSDLAILAEQSGDIQLAVEYLGERLRINRAHGTKADEASAHLSLAVIYHRLADETKAREHYGRLFEAAREIQPPTVESLDLEGFYFTNMANLVRGMNGGEIPVDAFGPRTPDDFRAAINYLKGALEVNRRMESGFRRNARLYTFNLLQMANSHKELAEYSEALDYLNRFAAHPSSASKPQRARVEVLFGSVYAKMGDMRKAAEHFDEVVKLMREGVNPGNYHGYFHNMARDYAENGDATRALELYREAMTVARNRASPGPIASSLYEIARIERELGNFNNSRKSIEEAIAIVEDVRSRITIDELRTSYFSSVRRYYEFYTDLLMQTHKAQPEKGFDRLALETSERGRSRSLLDLLNLSGVKVENGVSPELRAKERSLRDLISKKADEHSRLVLRRAPASEVDAAMKAVTDLTAEYSSVQAEIRRRSPAYAQLTQAASLESAKIQSLLDSGTVMLEYSLGEKKSYLWAISQDSIATFDLPGRRQIEAEARQAYEQLTARNKVVAGETPEQRRARVQAADAAYARSAASLSEMLLGPAAKVITNKRIVIVPDGALHYVSFAALPLPAATGQSEPVGSVHEIVALPSASVLARLRADKAARGAAANMLAVFADPVFTEKDVRASQGKVRRTATDRAKQTGPDVGSSISRDFERAIEAAGFGSGQSPALPRLPFSRREAESIFSVSPQRLSLKRTDFDASKNEVFSAGLEKFRTVHFATHALLDSQHPELSGIVLSLVDRNGANVDGYLRLHDIYNLRLNADLVVLSACNTALGKEIKGEGVVGLTRGFMYAGSPRVVASLWKVDDSATAALMTIFYRKMHVDNLRPAAALRAAQAEMMKEPRWRSPYYWAPFVLHGEWK